MSRWKTTDKPLITFMHEVAAKGVSDTIKDDLTFK